MSKHPSNDIYENLPCQAMYNESVRKIQNAKTGTANTSSNSVGLGGNNSMSQQQLLLNNISNQTHHGQQQQQQPSQHHTNNSISNNNLQPLSNNNKLLHGTATVILPGAQPKEMLYATPLRKSDRYKSSDRSRFSGSGGGASGGESSAASRPTSGSGMTALAGSAPPTKDSDKDGKLSNLSDYNNKHRHHHHQHQHHHQGQSQSQQHQYHHNAGRDSNRVSLRNGKVVPVTDLDDDTADGCSSTALVGGSLYTNQPASLPTLPHNDTPNQQLENRRILNFLKDTTQLQKKLEVAGGGRDCPNASFSNLAREEHFANLMQQNFPSETSTAAPSLRRPVGGLEIAAEESSHQALITSTQETADNLEVFMKRKISPDKEVNGIGGGRATASVYAASSNVERICAPVYIHREWVLKKIALCVEQRTAGKKNVPNVLGAASGSNSKGGAGGGGEAGFMSARAKAAAIAANSTYNGCLVLGSNGSGKTSICQAIMRGNSGTKGILNRKLLACYLIESQNPDCHSLSLFIRKMVLQILSHSSLIGREDGHRIIEDGLSFLQEEGQQQESKLDEAMNNISLDENVEDILIAELKRDAREMVDLERRRSSGSVTTGSSGGKNKKPIIMRQKSEPTQQFTVGDDLNADDSTSTSNNEDPKKLTNNFGTHPPKINRRGNENDTKERQAHLNIVVANPITTTEDKDRQTEKELKNITDSGEKESPSTSSSSKCSPSRKSKIPVKLGRTTTTGSVSSPSKSGSNQSPNTSQDIQEGGGEDIADLVNEESLKSEIEAAIRADDDEDDDNDDVDNGDVPKEKEKESVIKEDQKVENTKIEEKPDNEECKIEGNNKENTDNSKTPTEKDTTKDEANNLKKRGKHSNNISPLGDDENTPTRSVKDDDLDRYAPTAPSSTPLNTSTLPPPLPKPKSCRTIIADGYYEMLLSNPDIFECLAVDSIEKNPDECFKKALLFPLLELTPPKTALLLLIDSIDENYINEGNLISTLKGGGRNGSGDHQHKSRNVAELLSNHIHLFPKWLFLVCTTKKQTKQITKMFTGFKKITLDDLRKSHVVKDVQEYIINRLNSDFKDSIMLTKEIIESLHQLYIKSNGCILYLEKVLNGIKENFFSFREIKLIPCTLNGLYLYICQKSFNKKQYMKIRPVLNVLLASSGYVDKLFLFNCLRTHNYTIDAEEFEKRLHLMRNILAYDAEQKRLKIFHNSFSDWLVDVKFATKKFICDVNEGHVMIAMYYLLVSETLCPSQVRKFVYHLLKSGEYLSSRNIELDVTLMMLESRLNLNECFYTSPLNCCAQCELEFRSDTSFLPKTRVMLERFLGNELSEEFGQFLCDFFKPSLPTDGKVLKLLIETGINNAYAPTSCESSLMSPELSERSQNIDFELADLLISSEKSCMLETQQQRPLSPSEQSEQHHESQDENASSTLHQLSDSNRIELHKGKALIHILANDGNHHLLERALNACKGPIDLEIEDYNGQTALNIASRNGHLEVVKLLLGFSQPANDGTGRMKRIDVNHADRDGWTPLRSASWGGHTEVVKLLIAQPACKIDLADKEGRTALRAAAWSGHEDILKILIESGADVNSVDRQGRTSLIAASYMGHYDIVEILLENGANVNHLDLDGRSALCVAALCGSSGYSKVISTLLEHGANTDQLDNDGMSPLLVSSFEGNAEVCELLLENGADPDLADFMGRTPLWAACTAGHANVVKLLLFWGCGIDCMDSEGRTVLSIAAAQGNLETVRQLLDRGLDETHRDNAGWTPLHYAAFEGFHEVCLQLLESGAKIDECDNEGKTALHLAAQEGRTKCVQVLLDIHAIFVDQKAHDGKTAFRLGCLEGHLDTVEYLLRYSCDVNAKDADSRTTLYILALENKLEIVKYLLQVAGTAVDVNVPDSEGRSALHVAAWQGHSEMVKLLITLGNADVNAMDLEARTPLHSCAWQGNHDVMNILLYFGALADHACKQGATALGISAQEGHEKCVIALLKYGANPYKSDHCGRTPIKLAAKSNRTNILKIFENYAKTESNNALEANFHPNLVRSPVDQQPPSLPPHQQIHELGAPPYPQHASASSVCSAATTATVNNNNNGINSNCNAGLLNSNNNGSMKPPSMLNASNSTHSSNNFYQNTMQSDASSLHKRKSVISSQSTGSSNDVPLTFTQQLQRQTKLNSRNNPFVQNAPVVNSRHASSSGGGGMHKSGVGGAHGGVHMSQQRHSQLLPDLSEHQMASHMGVHDADLYDMECMSPLYATPPHSPSSELSSPGQLPAINAFDDIMGACGSGAVNNHHSSSGGGGGSNNGSKSALPDNHFARDTHMRIILGNLKENQSSSSSKSKRSGITTNPAMRLIRSRFDSAAQLIRRTNNMLSSNSNQGSSSIGVKSGTFQWRKESQM